MIDPPEGWKYGFPKIYEGSMEDLNIRHWLIEKGYPEKLIEAYEGHFYTQQNQLTETKDVEKVQAWVSISGDYCAWHEVGIGVFYDETNDKLLNDWILEYYEEDYIEPKDRDTSRENIMKLIKKKSEEEWNNDSCDIEKKELLLIDGKYYLPLD